MNDDYEPVRKRSGRERPEFFPVLNGGMCWLCPKPAYCRGYCLSHYNRLRLGESRIITVTIPGYWRTRKTGRRDYVPAYLVRHKARKWRVFAASELGIVTENWYRSERELTPYDRSATKPVIVPVPRCATTGCQLRIKWRGLCQRCYSRAVRQEKTDAEIAAGRKVRNRKNGGRPRKPTAGRQ